MGYLLYDQSLNGADYGLPQSRDRAWFLGIREDLMTHKLSQDDFKDLLDVMKITTHLPIARFLLNPDHEYLLQVQADRKKVTERRAIANAKAKAKSNKAAKKKSRATSQRSPAAVAAASAAAEKDKRKKGFKWVCDHWKARRLMNIPPSVTAVPPEISDAVSRNCMTQREADLWQMCHEGPQLPSSSSQPTVELKHNALRVLSLKEHTTKQRKREGTTSCLLPTSKLLVRPPVVPQARFLLGLEALSIQSIDEHWLAADRVMSDSEYLNLAGNAFS